MLAVCPKVQPLIEGSVFQLFVTAVMLNFNVTDASSVEVQTDQVKKFNPGGIIVSGDSQFNYADATVSKVLNVVKAQDLLGVAVDDKGFIYVVDSTYGRRTRAVIITDSDHVILSSVQPETIINRFNAIDDSPQ